MKEKLLVLACAVSLLASAAAVAASLSVRARAAEAAAPAAPAPLPMIARSPDTEIYLVRYQGNTCFVASTAAGSSVSISCPAR
ncbi:MAG: hypothetical protein KGM24_15165 [Elusimicrobia bacterium]|nr:hypothetical protein [Elusimicrobiota bacterium]